MQVRGDAKILTSNPVNQRISVELHVDEGQLYRLAGITFRNNRALTNSSALRNLFLIKDGDVVQRSALAKGLDDLRRAYGEYGYLNATFVPDTRFDEATQTISLVVDVDEGKQFFVRDVRVLGVDGVTSERLLRDSPLQPGNVYSQRLAEYFFSNPALRMPAGGSLSSRIHLNLDKKRGTVAITFDLRPCPGGKPSDATAGWGSR